MDKRKSLLLKFLQKRDKLEAQLDEVNEIIDSIRFQENLSEIGVKKN